MGSGRAFGSVDGPPSYLKIVIGRTLSALLDGEVLELQVGDRLTPSVERRHGQLHQPGRGAKRRGLASGLAPSAPGKTATVVSALMGNRFELRSARPLLLPHGSPRARSLLREATPAESWWTDFS